MEFLVNSAWAQAGGTQGNPLMSFLPLIIIFVLFYFLLIRPQSKRQKEHKQMIESLESGAEVVTGGGLLGKVTDVGPDKDAGKNYTSLRNYSSQRGDSGNIELFCSRCRRGTTHSFFKKDSDALIEIVEIILLSFSIVSFSFF